MHHFNLLAAATAEAGTSMFDTMVHFVGMGIIIVSIIWSAYCLITYLIRRFSPAGFPARVPVRGTPRSVDPSQAGSAIRPEVLAVIAAAVKSTIGQDHKIVSIKSQDSNWERAGRQAVLSSHRIR
jgi:Na+-transporting methylmalonyl-CoA/oxaloacetate decarboxylase gamma subunit